MQVRICRLTRVLSWGLLIAWVCVINILPALAQAAATATLYPLQTDAFPRLAAYLDVRDAQGNFVAGLQAGKVLISEGDQQFPADTLTELHPGAQFVVAIASGAPFAIRDGLGNSRYFYVSNALTAWANSRLEAETDDLSLIAADGPVAPHLSTAEAWLGALTAYQPEGRETIPTLEPLARAIDVASDSPPRDGMGRAILFITPPQPPEALIGLANLGSRAAQQNIRIHIWYVSAPELFTSQSATQLQDLAAQTGGQFTTFSGQEEIPNPENYLSPLRDIYILTYTSRLTTSGNHTVSVQIAAGDVQAASAPQNLALTVQPPTPIFVSLPLEIERQWAPASQDAEPDLNPDRRSLEILIEFPDGHPRPIKRTALYVDGIQVAENMVEPFGRFTWDISGYTQSGQHLLRVEAEDSLGLKGASLETPVQIAIPARSRGLMALLTQQGALLAGAVVAAAGAILALVLILGGRIRPRSLGQGKAARPIETRSLRLPGLTRPPEDPLTQPVPIKSNAQSRPNWMSRLHWPHRHPVSKAIAYLTPLSETDEVAAVAPIPLLSEEMAFGRDPANATLLLDDPSIEPLHARLKRDNGSFRLFDEGSIAGTWINYTPVSREGMLLEHGDLIHVGRVGFRFTLREPALRKPVITLQEPGS